MRGKMEHIGPERLDVKRVVAAYEKDESGERTGKVLYFDARTGEQIDIESQKRVFMGGKKEIKNMADRIRERLN